MSTSGGRAGALRPRGGVVVDVITTSRPGQQIEVTGAGFDPTPMRAEGERYVARIAASTAPAEVTVTNLGDVPLVPFPVPVTDTVTITDAAYDLDASVLIVAATSSDSGAAGGPRRTCG